MRLATGLDLDPRSSFNAHYFMNGSRLVMHRDNIVVSIPLGLFVVATVVADDALRRHSVSMRLIM